MVGFLVLLMLMTTIAVSLIYIIVWITDNRYNIIDYIEGAYIDFKKIRGGWE